MRVEEAAIARPVSSKQSAYAIWGRGVREKLENRNEFGHKRSIILFSMTAELSLKLLQTDRETLRFIFRFPPFDKSANNVRVVIPSGPVYQQ